MNILYIVYSFSKTENIDIHLYFKDPRNKHSRPVHFNPLKHSFSVLDSFIKTHRGNIKKGFCTWRGDDFYNFSFLLNENQIHETRDYFNFLNCTLKNDTSLMYLENKSLSTEFHPLKENEFIYLGDLQIADPKLKKINLNTVYFTNEFYLTKNIEVINLGTGVMLCYQNNLYCLQKVLKKYMSNNTRFTSDQIDLLDNSVILFLWNIIQKPENLINTSHHVVSLGTGHREHDKNEYHIPNKKRKLNKFPKILVGVAWDKYNDEYFHWSLSLNQNIEHILGLIDQERSE